MSVRQLVKLEDGVLKHAIPERPPERDVKANRQLPGSLDLVQPRRLGWWFVVGHRSPHASGMFSIRGRQISANGIQPDAPRYMPRSDADACPADIPRMAARNTVAARHKPVINHPALTLSDEVGGSDTVGKVDKSQATKIS